MIRSSRQAGPRPAVIGALASVIILVTLTTHAARAADGRAPVKSLMEMRQEGVVVQERDLSCGAAALATILTYQHGDPVPEEVVVRGLITREEYLVVPELVKIRQGFSLLDLKRFVDARGYEGIGYGELTLDDLVDLAPAIVPVDLNGYHHFVVFRGTIGDRALLADPAFGMRTMRADRFNDAWLESPVFGKVGFVVERPERSTSRNRLAPDPNDVLTPHGAALRQAVF